MKTLDRIISLIRIPLFIFMLIYQFIALFDGLDYWLGLHWIITSILAFLITKIPIFAIAAGMFGAKTVWGWSWIQTVMLFFGPQLMVMLIYSVFGGGVKIYSLLKRAN